VSASVVTVRSVGCSLKTEYRLKGYVDGVSWLILRKLGQRLGGLLVDQVYLVSLEICFGAAVMYFRTFDSMF